MKKIVPPPFFFISGCASVHAVVGKTANHAGMQSARPSTRVVLDTGCISGIQHYPALFEVSGQIVLRYPAGYQIFSKFREIAWSRLGKNKIYLFDLWEKIWYKLENFNFVLTLHKK